METLVYNQQGKETGKIMLPENIFGLHKNADLVHQVITSLKTNARKPYAHTKTRGEVRGGGKKPWQQKGTGRARHGSTRSPIWVGGGVAHGPRNDKSFERKIGRTMKAKALFTILSEKLKAKEILFVDKIALSAIKTKSAKEVLASLGVVKGFEGMLTKRNNAIYLALGSKDATVEKSFQNLSNLFVTELRNISPVELLNYKYIVITEPETSVAFLAGKTAKSAKASAEPKKTYKKKVSASKK